MGTDAHTPSSDEETPEWEDWDSFSENDKMKKQEKVTEYLTKRTTIEKFGEECKNIGQTAVAIDRDFRQVKTGLANLVKKYGGDFPGIEKVHLPKWIKLKARWEGKEGILWASRNFASKTAAALSDYGDTLKMVAEITSNRKLKDAQAELKSYIDRHPISHATEIADMFKDLSRDVGDFSKDFKEYIEEQKQFLTEDAEQCEADIAQYQAEVDEFNHKIMVAAITLGCTWIFGLLALIPLGFLIYFVVERNKAQANLNEARAKLAGTFRKQQALAAMQAGFEKLKPNIDDICFKLGIFAGIWAFVYRPMRRDRCCTRRRSESGHRKEIHRKYQPSQSTDRTASGGPETIRRTNCREVK
ncbi:hypothetical protein AGABI2DRAFT_194403 [Agaricus bisporus var. bisporus H97]|uniref:hypothetical protein n=1 Tax=Agaricus bisporus var. bisporus (strain H97 / ATCC MYA-4626 / FGSC 10389) TaxID=936046 RepID=UPI00029F7075|nr:hypothetical protein AGABI2DRAFT_194403 [Agaricus bisporus var. bisporus H97]EKV44315.1 hypothetical protein AGABI2DRAFT_194403 [Agaricus bisporus var. bisporus H97]